jgi:sulfate transport system substrate-binding protein
MNTFRKSIATVLLGLVASAALADATLLNASYDVARDVYKDYNPMFQKYWKAKTGESLELKQSHGGSTKQVRAVADGLEADVVTMNQANDIEFLADKGLVAKDWAKKFPNNASPYTSTMVFIVRKGNPKGIKDWSDLAAPGIQMIIPHPKNTGNGRNTYLSAWAWASSSRAATTRARRNSSASC